MIKISKIRKHIENTYYNKVYLIKIRDIFSIYPLLVYISVSSLIDKHLHFILA